jgi:hypothetical protein
LRDALALLGAAVLSVACAALIVVGGLAMLAPVAVMVIAGIAFSARFRILFLIFGGMAVFQSSSQVSVLKTGYVIAAALAVVVAAAESSRRGEARTEPTLNLVFGASFLFIGVLTAPTIAGVLAGTAPLDAMRDGFPYVLLAASPVLALDAARAFDVRALRAIFVTLGILAGVSFAVNWLDRRGLASLAVDRVFLSSLMLCGATVAYAVSRIVNGDAHGRTAWVVVSCAIPAMVFATGTRAGLLLLLIPIAMFFVASQLTWMQRIAYGFVGLVAGTVAVVAVVLALVAVAGIDKSSVEARLTSIPGVSTNAIASQSLRERGAQREAARAIWSDYPVAGAGAGVRFSWFDPFGRPRTAFTIDSALSFPAKFGLIGMAALAFWIWAAARLVRARRRLGAVVAADSLTVFTVFAATYGLLTSPLEEKGLAFGVIMMFSLLMAESRIEQ